MERIEKERILVVEDDEQVAGFLGDALEQAGYGVAVAQDGLRGWELAESRSYGAMIIDIMLPGIPGLELIERLRDRRISTPSLLIYASFAE